MEMNMAKFSEKLGELMELAKKKKNVLEYQEINDFFKDFPLDPEHLDKVFDFLEANGIDVLRIQEDSFCRNRTRNRKRASRTYRVL